MGWIPEEAAKGAVKGAATGTPWGMIAGIGSGLLQGIMGGRQQSKENERIEEDRKEERMRYNERAPFRDYAVSGLGASNAPVNSESLFRSKVNPFAANFDYSQDLGANRMQAPAPRQAEDRTMEAVQAYAAMYQNAPPQARRTMKPPAVVMEEMKAKQAGDRDRIAQDQMLARYGQGGR